MFHPTNFRSSTRLALGLAGLLLLAHTQAQAQCVTPLQTFGYTGSIVSYSVPSTGDYWLEAAGAEGGNHQSSTYRPGRGAIVGGKFHLTAGTSLDVLVGGKPSLAGVNGNGGGGGSFVVLAGSNPLHALVVGGGGAGSAYSDSSGKHGQATPNGASGGELGGVGGSAGSGGGAATAQASAGGGGLLGNGADGTWSGVKGGLAFIHGGAGGTSGNSAPGGFGGGGAGSFVVTSGGGGGYSGGGGGEGGASQMGGGGGSFNEGADPIALTGATDGHSGHGQVRICTTPLTAMPATLTAGVVGSAYGPITLSATGGLAPYTWSGLPTGMSVDESTGELSGTPAAGTQGSYTITVSDSYQTTPRTATLSLTVLPTPLVITTTGSLPEAGEGQAYSQQLLVTGGTAPYSWSVVTGSLPPGLTLDATGLLSGTVPKAALLAGQAGQVTKAAGSFSFGVQVSDSSPQPQSAEQQLSLQVTAAEVVPPAPTPVPSLGAWAIALLNLVAAGMGVLAWRWRRKPFQA